MFKKNKTVLFTVASKTTNDKISLFLWLTFHCISTVLQQNKITKKKKKNPIRYIGINLTKMVKDLYIENYKILMKSKIQINQ